MRYSNLPKAMDFRDIVTMDIKELTPEHKKGGYKYILYMTDEFSKYTKAVLTQHKEANTVISAVYTQWIIGTNGLGHGTPRLHIYSDNGTEFISSIGEQFSRQLDIALHYTLSHSPHSNGSCERNHYMVN